MYDVIVIGGGPVGSYVAYKLAGTGHKVVVLEQKEKLGGHVCCTGIISQECVDSFTIDDSVVLNRASSAKLFTSSGRLLRLWRQETQSCIVDRAAFDMSMAKRAQDNGAQYVLNNPVKGIEVKDDRVRVKVAQQGKEIDFEARAVVIATGFSSRLTERLALGKISDFVMGVQAEVETIGVQEMEIYFSQEMAPGFFAWLVPTSALKALVGLAVHRNSKTYLRKFILFLKSQGKIASADVNPSYRAIPLKPLPRTYSQRLIVVGDAAGQVKPTTGGGIYFGLLSADIAAKILDRALDNNALSAKNLAAYEREWKRKLGRELKIDYYARKFYEHLSDSQIDRAFDIIKSVGIDEILRKRDDLAFDWHGEAILKLLGHGILSKAVKTMRIRSG
ncbi:NAD(P)/FAD-dependent oxidoreductase [Chloroflexota bacterium]